MHVAVDLVGVFTSAGDRTKTGRVVARGAPYRSFDTGGDGLPLAAGAMSVNFYGLDDEVAATVQAALVNVTVTEGTHVSYLSVYLAIGPSGAGGR